MRCLNSRMFLKLRKEENRETKCKISYTYLYNINIQRATTDFLSFSRSRDVCGKFPISLSIDETNGVCVCMVYDVCGMQYDAHFIDAWCRLINKNRRTKYGCCCCYYYFIGITSLPDLTINTWLPAMWMWKILRGSTKCPHAHIRVYDFQLIKTKQKRTTEMILRVPFSHRNEVQSSTVGTQ